MLSHEKEEQINDVEVFNILIQQNYLVQWLSSERQQL